MPLSPEAVRAIENAEQALRDSEPQLEAQAERTLVAELRKQTMTLQAATLAKSWVEASKTRDEVRRLISTLRRPRRRGSSASRKPA